MKQALNWVKSNLVIVVLVVVTVIALPVLLFFSNRMNAALRADVQKQVDDDWRAIQQVSVTYSIPSLAVDNPPVEFSRPPNAQTTEHISKLIEQLKGQSTAIVEAAVERNRAGKSPMMEGLFPAPEPAAETRFRQQANEVWLQAHRDLLTSARAGSPPDPEAVLSILQTRQSQLQQRLGDGEEAAAQLQSELSEARLNIYKARAADLWVYATPEIFAGVQPWRQTTLPTLAEIWDWQHRLWVHQDIIRAIVKANSHPVNGAPLSIPDAPVKRIESIDVPVWVYETQSAAARTRAEDGARAGGPNLEASVTGRAAWPLAPNTMYDLRYATVTLLVSGRDLPRVIDAFTATNFTTVLDCRLEAVDGAAALPEGYYYGPDDIVRARFTLETLWLRSWMEPLMPEAVKAALGVAAPARARNEEINQ